MWGGIFNFHRSCFLANTIDDYGKRREVLPFTDVEINRLRFGLPFAFTALLFDALDLARIREDDEEPRAKGAAELLGALSLRWDARCTVGELIVLPPELELIRRELGLPSHRPVGQIELSEERIGKVITQFRLQGYQMALAEKRRSDSGFNMEILASPESRNARTLELIAGVTSLCVTGMMDAMDDERKVGFVTEVFVPVQGFYDEYVIPAFRKVKNG